MALQKIANAGESLKSAGDKVTDVGKKMSVVSAGIVAAGTASTKALSGVHHTGLCLLFPVPIRYWPVHWQSLRLPVFPLSPEPLH